MPRSHGNTVKIQTNLSPSSIPKLAQIYPILAFPGNLPPPPSIPASAKIPLSHWQKILIFTYPPPPAPPPLKGMSHAIPYSVMLKVMIKVILFHSSPSSSPDPYLLLPSPWRCSHLQHMTTFREPPNETLSLINPTSLSPLLVSAAMHVNSMLERLLQQTLILD